MRNGGLSHTFRHISTKTQLRARIEPAPAQSRNLMKLGLTTAPKPIFSNLFQAFLNPFPVISSTPRVHISSQTKQLESKFTVSLKINPTMQFFLILLKPRHLGLSGIAKDRVNCCKCILLLNVVRILKDRDVFFSLKENSIRKQKLVYLIWKSFNFFLSFSVSFASRLPSKSVVQMSVSNHSSKNNRFIIYSAKLLVPTKLSLETTPDSQKKRKHESSEVSRSIQNQTLGLPQWIDSHTDFDFAVVSNETGSENSGSCFRWCEDSTSDHQHIMVCSDNPKQMKKTVKAFVWHEGKVLYEIRTRMFITQSPF